MRLSEVCLVGQPDQHLLERGPWKRPKDRRTWAFIKGIVLLSMLTLFVASVVFFVVGWLLSV